MNDKHKLVEPIPEEFSSYEEAADFWDSHDTTDYLDEFETVSVDAELQQRRFEVEIEENLMKVLARQAQQQGVGVNQLVNNVLRKTLEDVA
ncbi:MAG: CopG family antitoxin [Xenococcaceae cyanobacterium MO_188.B32]|nr:CopG family antitoxin [Xenococcaceae cyanobacterium MO_188.B32]